MDDVKSLVKRRPVVIRRDILSYPSCMKGETVARDLRKCLNRDSEKVKNILSRCRVGNIRDIETGYNGKNLGKLRAMYKILAACWEYAEGLLTQRVTK